MVKLLKKSIITHVSNRFTALEDSNNLNINKDNLKRGRKKDLSLGQINLSRGFG